MTIFLTNLKRILRNKVNIVFMVIFPAAMIAFILSLASNFVTVSVGLVDEDNTFFTQKVIEHLEEKCHVKLIKREDIQYEITDMSVDTVFVFEKGFTDELIAGKSPDVIQYTLQETNLATPIKMSVDSFINSASNIAKSAGGDSTKFYDALDKYINGNTTVKTQTMRNINGELDLSSTSLGFLVMSMLFLGFFAPSIMIKDKENKTVYRLLTAPVSAKRYMFQNVLSFFVISIIQVAVLFGMAKYVFKLNLGLNPMNLVVASLFFSLVCVSLGTAVNSYAKDLHKAGIMSSLLLSPMCMLGGCWWPLNIMPKFLQDISNFIPTTWIMKSYNDLLVGKNLLDIADKLAVLLAFSLVFFLLAAWRKTDIAK